MEDIVTFQGSIDQLVDRDVYSSDGHRIGSVGQVFVMEGTEQPTWVTVQTGLFGTHESFVPVAEVTQRGGDLQVPYEKSFVKDAPRIDNASELTVEQEAELYRYYGVQPPMPQQAGQGADDRDRGRDDEEGDRSSDGRAGRHADTRLGRDGERGGPRLRRRIVTEMQTIQVPVQREEIVVEDDGMDQAPDDERR